MKFLHFALTALPLAAGLHLPQQHIFRSVELDSSSKEPLALTPFKVVSSSAVPHQLRIKETVGLCDQSVKQHSGYLDSDGDDGKHLFFWFFESRRDPLHDPLVLWLNGGPGCSSTIGLLFELGPCNIAANGMSTTHNAYSWTERANMIFLDSPVAAGFSYADDGSTLNNSNDVGRDVYAFLQLFYSHFPIRQAAIPRFGESYAGVYIPHVASEIHERNKEVKATKSGAHLIPLASIGIGNGITDPVHQATAFADFSCFPSATTVFNESTCQELRAVAEQANELIRICYNDPTDAHCVAAVSPPGGSLLSFHRRFDANPYNVRAPCTNPRAKVDSMYCYDEMEWIETYLDRPEIKRALGLRSDVPFAACNTSVADAFVSTGDVMRNTAALLPPLLADGIRVLIYAGDLDWMCNWIGNQRWFLQLKTHFDDDSEAHDSKPWHNLHDGILAGETISRGGGNFSYARIHNAGHMVPHDQPANALDLFSRWLDAEALT